MLAVASGSVPSLNVLLKDDRVNLNLQDVSGETALHLA